MSDDKFNLSIGQAQQLEFAFQRNGWTAADVHAICQKDALAGFLIASKAGDQMLGYNLIAALNAVGVSDFEIRRLTDPSAWSHTSVWNPRHKEEWVQWRDSLLGYFGAVMHGKAVVMLKTELEGHQQVWYRSRRRESEYETMQKLLKARIDRPLEDVFTPERCGAGRASLRGRTLSLLRREGVCTLRDLLIATTSRGGRMYPAIGRRMNRPTGMGAKSFDMIDEVLDPMGLYMGMFIPDDCM